MRLQSAIFDMDGVLVDSMAVWNNATAALLRARGIEPDAATQEKIMSLTLRQGLAYCREAYSLPLTVDELMDHVSAYMEDFYTHRVELKPGVKKFLSLLKMEGVWMYIATNTDHRLVDIALKRTGIDGYFRGIVTCAEAGAGKRDSAEVYERCMRRMQSNKKDTVVFEDALHAIRTAKAAGFRVCAVYDAPAADKQEEIRSISDYYIHSFEEMFTSEIPD